LKFQAVAEKTAKHRRLL